MSGSLDQANGGLRRSGRTSRPTREIWLRSVEENLRRVTYEADPDRAAGSRRVSATFGPLSWTQRANDADPSLPRGIKLAREHYPACGFKAGHMLNCELGGNGRRAENLTILTASANTAMTRYDNNLKRAVHYLGNLYRLLYDAGVQGMPTYCVTATIAVGERWGAAAPDKHITRALTIEADHEGDFQLGPDATERQRQDIENVRSAVEGMVHAACGVVNNSNPAGVRR